MDRLAPVLRQLLGPTSAETTLPLVDPRRWLEPADGSPAAAAAALNAAFLLRLAGRSAATDRAGALLDNPPAGSPDGLASFYHAALAEVDAELARRDDLGGRLESAATALAELGATADRRTVGEACWELFFPAGVGILGREEERIGELRERRTVHVEQVADEPIGDPASEVLFTSNVLLTVPAAGRDIDALPYPPRFRRALAEAAAEPQRHWYDHPIQIGVELERNELIYGLRGLDAAMDFERARRPALVRLTVVLSVSVTHDGLQALAHDYVRRELERAGGLRNLDVYLFTERETARLVDEVLAPAAPAPGAPLGAVFGVDGEYGRHYSFLKAIAALWHVAIDQRVRATFKVDLDQVFPQELLLAETGASALEHLRTSLWGARGRDADGRPVELGMLAGALVNERDIGRGLFTPDVPFPDGPAAPDEYVFFSRLPQALSTRAEMMERHAGPPRDGRTACLERVHVTGGTNGIRVDALRRHRPFTPTFIGRAEDQAYILSVLDGESGPRLAYAHAAGLIMRHDKEAFATEAIEAARLGKLVGDDVRILYFSAYGRQVGRQRAKALLDPFTGSFISDLPATVVLLRHALRIAHASAAGRPDDALQLATIGADRLAAALRFATDDEAFARRLGDERSGWQAYYDGLDRLERGLRAGDAAAATLCRRARQIVESARLDAMA